MAVAAIAKRCRSVGKRCVLEKTNQRRRRVTGDWLREMIGLQPHIELRRSHITKPQHQDQQDET